MGSHRVGHNWSDLAAAATSVEWINERKHIPLQNHRGRKTSKNLLKKTSQRRNLTNATPAKWSINIISEKSCWHYAWQIRCDEDSPSLFQSSSKKAIICTSSWEKTSDKSYLRDLLQNPWVVFLKTVNVIKTKKRVRNCHSQEESKETGWLIMVWYPRWVPRTEKRTLGKKQRHMNMWRHVNKVWTSVSNNITVLVH